jgi:hypothetical protein
MPVPDFSPGEVLTAAAMDSIGLWLVKTQTIGAAVATVVVADAFSADYDNYLVTVAGGAASGTTILNLQLGATTSNYFSQYIYTDWNNTVSADSGTVFSNFRYIGAGTTSGLQMRCEIFSPNLAKTTRIFSPTGAFGASFAGFSNGWLNNTTQYTGFTIGVSTGTITGGTIRVYGYRN